jgi:hypothetical protein
MEKSNTKTVANRAEFVREIQKGCESLVNEIHNSRAEAVSFSVFMLGKKEVNFIDFHLNKDDT